MKKPILIIVLGLFLITPSLADDISDFQIDGMSIGDSALDYFSEAEINKPKKAFYPSDDKFFRIGLSSKNDTYESVEFHFK